MSAALAASLFAVDPVRFGGLRLRARVSPARELFLADLAALLPEDAPLKRMPASISEDRLLGGLDLGATLATGQPVAMRGLLGESDGGVIFASMAERISAHTIAHLCTALDTGSLQMEREGMHAVIPARFGLVALDEGEEDEGLAPALLDRLAFHVGEPDVDLLASKSDIQQARDLMPRVELDPAQIDELVTVAMAFGIASPRACLFALHAARACAALNGRNQVNTDDLQEAARLVLSPRATQLPAPPQEQEQETEHEQPTDQPEQSASDDQPEDDSEINMPEPGAESMVEAVRAALPVDLLRKLVAGDPAKRGPQNGGSGLERRTLRRGRPAGSRAGELSGGARLALLDTLRAAAPKQILRKKLLPQGAAHPPLLLRKEDLRIKRLIERTRVATIFVVDASGSQALHRLGEAKGAVQLLLAECYVRRDEAALISFRGKEARLLLPPTRSLARVRRELAQLPGGGGTPLALGISMAANMAESIRRKGDTPVLVFFTDGQANVTASGIGDRPQAEADAIHAARQLRASGTRCLLIDTSPRPQPRARKLADDLGARYLPLPAAQAQKLSAAVKAELPR